MTDRISVRYFKRDKLVDWDDGEEHKVENLEVVFQISNGTQLELFKYVLYKCDSLTCSSTPWNGIDNDELKAELQWLAINQRGIFRLLAMYLKPHTKVYQGIVNLAAEHGITI